MSSGEDGKKTWGRELAICSLFFWLVFTWHYFFNVNESADLVMAYSAAYTSATISIWAFIMAMFSVDKVVKHK